MAVHEDYMKHGELVVQLVHEYWTKDEAIPEVARCPLQGDNPEFPDAIPPLSWCVNFKVAIICKSSRRASLMSRKAKTTIDFSDLQE